MNAVSEQVPYAPPVLDGLALLADPTRSRLLRAWSATSWRWPSCAPCSAAAVDGSRHLKMLADDGWVAARAEGASRYYRPRPSTGCAERAAPVARWCASRRRRLARADHDRRRLQRRARPPAAPVRAVLLHRRRAVGRAARRAVRRAPRPARPPRAAAARRGRRRPRLRHGPLAAALAPFVASVVAVDRRPTMLRPRASGSTAPATSSCGGRARGAAHRRRRARRSRCGAGPAPRGRAGAALAEVARVLKPGGRLRGRRHAARTIATIPPQMGHVWLGFDRAAVEARSPTRGSSPAARADLADRGAARRARPVRRHRAPAPVRLWTGGTT